MFAKKLLALSAAALTLMAILVGASSADAADMKWSTGTPANLNWMFQTNSCTSVYTPSGPSGMLWTTDARINLSPAPYYEGEEAQETVDMWVGIYVSRDHVTWSFWKWGPLHEQTVSRGVASSAELQPEQFFVPSGWYARIVVYVEWKTWNFYTARFRTLGSTHLFFDANEYSVGNSGPLRVTNVGDGCYFG